MEQVKVKISIEQKKVISKILADIIFEEILKDRIEIKGNKNNFLGIEDDK